MSYRTSCGSPGARSLIGRYVAFRNWSAVAIRCLPAPAVPVIASSAAATASPATMQTALQNIRRRVRSREEKLTTHASFVVVSSENRTEREASMPLDEKLHSCHEPVTDTAHLGGYH